MQFELDCPQGDGASLRTHLRRYCQNTGTVDERLKAVCPPAGQALWAAFSSMGRPSGSGGFSYLTQQEIAAWQANNGMRFTGWELDTIRALDDAAAGAAARQKATQQAKQ